MQEKRWLALFFLLLGVMAFPAAAACRPESGLTCNQVIDLTNTKVTQTGARAFTIVLVVTQPFRCGGAGGGVLAPGCPKDGVQFKPDISRNVATAVQSTQLCTIFSGTANAVGDVEFGFRVRFEQGKAFSPRRKTCVLRFKLGGGTGARPFTLADAQNIAPEE
jgi:hypothetical protein